MNTAPIYQVDAFTDRLFGGNPAAVCLLEQWPQDETMQRIAQENNLAETAFLVKNQDEFDIRWFTPLVEVDLCGHATLAAAHVLYQTKHLAQPEVRFNSKSGILSVSKNGTQIVLDFPTDPPEPCNEVAGLLDSLGLSNGKIFKGNTDLMVVVETESIVHSLFPDFNELSKLDVRGVIVTAPGKEVDFVSRFFAPSVGINEDPVTGSAHCTMTPYWAEEFGKTSMRAVQLSLRRGALHCELVGDRVKITGTAVTYLTGFINF